MKVTKHRDKILKALRQWFRIHKQPPTLEELCSELGMQPRQRATVQRWLKTMRGIDVDWDDNIARSLRLVKPDPELEQGAQLPAKETLQYLTTGLAEWREKEATSRGHVPDALRLGMSRMYLTSLLQGDKQASSNIPEFFEWAKKPVVEWKPAREEIQNLSLDATLVEDGDVSDFALQWQVTGKDVEKEVQEKVLLELLQYCRANQLQDQYVTSRKLIIEHPVLPFVEFRRLLSNELRPLRDFLLRIYIDLIDLVEEKNYHFCPRCKYVMRKYKNSYICQSHTCERISAEKKLSYLPPVSKEDAEILKIVKPGVHRYGTIPGIWELDLANALNEIGVHSVKLWPEIDEFDLLVEFSKKNRWAIDVKDWAYLGGEDDERLLLAVRKLQNRSDFKEVFIVFPDTREQLLSIRARREQLEPLLGGVRLRLISEIIDHAKEVLKKNHA
jgi:REase associating with pPIWI_RE/pPIWI_RE three-gene island domain Y